MADSNKVADAIRADAGYTQAFLQGMRTRMTNYSAEMQAGSGLLQQPLLENFYYNNGFARLICDKPAEEMTRAGFKLVNLDEDTAQLVQSRLEELDATKVFNKALKFRRAFGGSVVIVGIKDGGRLAEAVNEESVNGIDFLRVYSSFEAIVDSRYSDPENPKYGEVATWKIQPKTTNMPAYVVHESRLLIFDGEEVSTETRIGSNGWGSSILQTCYNEITRLTTAHKWALLCLERMQQAVHSIPDLSNQVNTQEGEALVTKRLAVVDAVRSTLNTIAIDAEETYEIKSLSLGGVNEILDRFLRALSAVSGIPAFLLGENISGMNTGSSNKEGWYAQVESWQNDHLRRPLDRLVSLLILANSNGATDGADYTLEFKPLFTPSDTEQATINKTEADTLSAYITNGVMDQDEARSIVADKYNLIGDAPEPEPDEPEPLMMNPGQTLVSHPGAKLPPGKTKVLAKGAPIPPKKPAK